MHRGDRSSLLTHLIPFVLVAVAAIALLIGDVTLPQGRWLVAYLIAAVLLFGASTAYHAAIGTPREEGMNKLDHLGIHVQIASTGVIHMSVLPAIADGRTVGGLSVVAAMKGLLVALAIIGIVLRLTRGNAVGNVGFVIYGLMGATVLPVLRYSELFDTTAMWLTLAALLVYILSAVLLFPKDRLHAWWHVGVLAAGGRSDRAGLIRRARRRAFMARNARDATFFE